MDTPGSLPSFLGATAAAKELRGNEESFAVACFAEAIVADALDAADFLLCVLGSEDGPPPLDDGTELSASLKRCREIGSNEASAPGEDCLILHEWAQALDARAANAAGVSHGVPDPRTFVLTNRTDGALRRVGFGALQIAEVCGANDKGNAPEAEHRLGKWLGKVMAALQAQVRRRLLIVEVGCSHQHALHRQALSALRNCPQGQADLFLLGPKSSQTCSEATSVIQGPPVDVLCKIMRHMHHDRPPVSNVEPGFVLGLPSRSVSIVSHGLGLRRPLRVVCMSDTHGLHWKLPVESIPSGDILVHCGGFSTKGSDDEVKDFGRFLSHLPHPVKIVVGGDSDVGGHRGFSAAKAVELLGRSVQYLENTSTSVDGLMVYGSPWNKTERRSIPEGVDILVTHDAPQGFLDGGKGSKPLRLEVARTRPRVHVFGCQSRTVCNGISELENGPTVFVNAALANDGSIARRLDKTIIVLDMLPRPGTSVDNPSAGTAAAKIAALRRGRPCVPLDRSLASSVEVTA